MNDSFDRDIKKLLEDSNPEAVGYRPDREKLWQQIEGKQKRKKKVLPLWISHAAAVAAGLLIGIVLLSRDKEETAPAIVNTITVPVIKTLRDTVFITQPVHTATPVTPANPAAVAHATPDKPLLPAPAQQHDPIQQHETLPVVIPEPQEPVVATVVPERKKVLHLSDIGNENALPRPREKQRGGLLFTVLSNRDQPETYQETLSILVGKQFTPAKN